jgi:NADH-quinone oxidoreductase subunit N
MTGLLRSRFVREQIVPGLALVTTLTAIGLGIWQWGEEKDLIAGALRLDDLTLMLTFVFCTGAAASIVLSWRAQAPREAAHGEYYSLRPQRGRGHVRAGRGAEPRVGLPRSRAAVGPALRPVRDRDAPRGRRWRAG